MPADRSRYKEIISHAEVQFAPERRALTNAHNKELREAQFRARETHNAAALLPAEAECYIVHAKALIVARAKCVADAYARFNEPVGQEAEADLAQFSAMTVAGRMAAFKGQAELRAIRTRTSQSQLAGLLRGFEACLNEALTEGRAVLDRQRVEIKNRHVAASGRTKYVVDTSVFNWLADSVISKDRLPADGGFAITHIQVDEINDTDDTERRARLLLVLASLHCELLHTQTVVLDVSRLDYSRLGDGKLFGLLKARLDSLNNNKANNSRDALIAEAAIANGYTLLTADKHLGLATRELSGEVILYERARTSSTKKSTTHPTKTA